MKRAIALLLTAALFLSLCACGTATPAAPAASDESAAAPAAPAKEYTLEELQQITVQSALAYYYQNPHVQYDSLKINVDGTKRLTSGDAPEVAAQDNIIYSVCSDYMYDLYYNAFGYEFMGKPSLCNTLNMVKIDASDPMVAYHSDGGSDEAALEAAAAESRKVLQPGDVIVSYGTSGHAMLYIGDYKGDGVEYAIHCWGGKVDLETGDEKYESNGAIVIQPVDELCYASGKSPNWYLAKPAHSSRGISILRPLASKDFKFQPTPWALSRMNYLGIAVDRELDRNRYIAAQNGEEVALTLTVRNNGTADYTGVSVKENLPQGCALVDGSVTEGAAADGSTLSWTVSVPAGGSVKLGYKVKVAGALGDTVTFPGGTVADIPTPELQLTVGGKPAGEDQQKALVEAAKALADGGFTFADLDTINSLYRDTFGKELGLPKTVDSFCDAMLELVSNPGQENRQFERKASVPAEYEKVQKMIIPRHVSGYYYSLQNDTRKCVPEFIERSGYYQPGDFFFGTYGLNKTVLVDDGQIDFFVYLGGGKVLSFNKEGAKISTYNSTVGLAMKYSLFVGFRPTLAEENFFGN